MAQRHGGLDLCRDRVDSDDGGADLGEMAGHLTLTGSDVEHEPGVAEHLTDERQNLLGVLRVDPTGELTLPPVGVIIPALLDV